VIAALSGGVVTNAVNIAAVRPEEMEALAPFVPLCEKLGPPSPRGLGTARIGASRSSSAAASPLHDTRLLGIAVPASSPVTPRSRSTLVNAPQMAEERGIELVETGTAAQRTSPS
jgi:D-3-phosphoglycerate dehydrogenase/(S)-sulfolactate dehydrogenase